MALRGVNAGVRPTRVGASVGPSDGAVFRRQRGTTADASPGSTGEKGCVGDRSPLGLAGASGCKAPGGTDMSAGRSPDGVAGLSGGPRDPEDVAPLEEAAPGMGRSAFTTNATGGDRHGMRA